MNRYIQDFAFPFDKENMVPAEDNEWMLRILSGRLTQPSEYIASTGGLFDEDVYVFYINN